MSRGRRRTVKGLVALGSVLAFLSVFAIWVERQALDTDDWTETSSELLENEQIRTAVGDYLVDQLYENVDVERELNDILPGDLKDLAGPVSGGLRQVAGQGADELLKTSPAQSLWQEANRATHEQLVAVLEEEDGAVSTEDGEVTLNLGTLVVDLAEQVGIGANLAEQLPPDAAQITILRSDELGTAQDITAAVKGLAIVLTLLTLGAFGLAIYLSRGERWVTVLFTGLGFIAAGFAAIVARQIAGGIVVEQLVDDASVVPAADAAWSIGTSLLSGIAQTLIVFGALFAIAGWLGSPTGSAHTVRRWMAPGLRDRVGYVYTGLAVVVGIYFLLGPTQNLRAFLTTLILAGAAAFGIRELRRQTIEEFPDASSSEAFGRVWERLVGAVKSAGSGTGGRASKARRDREERAAARRAEKDAQTQQQAPSASPQSQTASTGDAEDSRLARLARLGELREKGILSDEEFAAEKKRLLGGEDANAQ